MLPVGESSGMTSVNDNFTILIKHANVQNYKIPCSVERCGDTLLKAHEFDFIH